MKASTVISVLKNPPEMLLIVRIAAFLLALPIMIRLLNIRVLIGRITPGRSRSLQNSMTLERVEYLCERMLQFARRVGLTRSCLRRSLVLYHFLRLYGVPVSINFGVKWAGTALTGHSWLTRNGDIFLDSSEKVTQFTSFFSLPMDRTQPTGASEREIEKISSLRKVSFD